MRIGHMTYHHGSQTLKGNIGGKLFHIPTHSAHGGTALPPGDYAIQHPISDPVHGIIALIVPATDHGAGVAGKWGPQLGKWAPQAEGKWAPPVEGKWAPQVENKWTPRFKAFPPLGQVFVLSRRPIPGRNCIVVSSRFADLMDALSAAGGAHIAVS